MSATSAPVRLTATRCPARASDRPSPCTCRPRTFTTRPDGCNRSSSSTLSRPTMSVPVTTVPKPFMEKTRSIGSRGGPSHGRAPADRANVASVRRRSGSPAPVRADTARTGAPSRNEPATRSWASSLTTSSVAGSARSDFVMTTSPEGTRSRRQISKCSRVCGMIDSSAATWSMTRSMPPAPASMFRTKRSWPGTSTNDRATPSSIVWANPSSIVIPRAFSSRRRSGSVLVKASTSELLP